MKLPKRRFIKIALIVVLILAIAIAVYPFLPLIKYYFSSNPENFGEVEQNSITRSEEEIALMSQGNLLIIPKIGVKVPIVEGEDESALDKGAWRMPETSTPEKGSNTVLTGHRWKFRPPNEKTFYLLDKLEAGDKFTIYWEGRKYEYKVVSISIVLPTDLSVLNPTADFVVTLITCTPLFSIAKRLIVVGELVK
jgi:LPXTG-site transpeptidase (sortase) family protein